MGYLKAVLLSLGIELISTLSKAEDIILFAASSMTDVLQEIGHNFEQKYPNDHVQFSFASSSALAKQIVQGAPADLFISADQKWMDYVIEKETTQVGTPQILVKNELVLIAPLASSLQPESIEKLDFKTILSDSYLAVGDPDHVPVGIYAKKALNSLKLWEVIEPKIARAKNVRDALLLVEREEAPLGIVYLTDSKVSNKVKVISTFPTESYDTIVYPVTLLSNKTAVQHFLAYLKTETSQQIFEKAGFVTTK